MFDKIKDFLIGLFGISVLGGGEEYATPPIVSPSCQEVVVYDTFMPSAYGFFTELLSTEDDIIDLKGLGAQYVILYTYQTDNKYLESVEQCINMCDKYKMGVILYLNCEAMDVKTVAHRFKKYSNLIGWYVYDEPSLHGISIDRQRDKIMALKSIKDVPCFTTECGAIQNISYNLLCADYDYVYSDIYVPKSSVNSPKRVFDSYGMIGPMFEYSIDKILPVYETYWEVANLSYLESNLLQKKRLYGNTKGGAFFIYSADETQSGRRTIKTDSKLRNAVSNVMSATVSECQLCFAGFHKRKKISPCRFLKTSLEGTSVSLDSVGSFIEIDINDTIKAAKIYVSMTKWNEASKVRVSCGEDAFIKDINSDNEAFVIQDLNSNRVKFENMSPSAIVFESIICVGIK